MASEKLFLRLFEVLEGQFLALKLQAVLIRNVFTYPEMSGQKSE